MRAEQYALPEGWVLAKVEDTVQPVGQFNPAAAPEAIYRYVDVSSISNERFEIEAPKIVSGATAPTRARQSIRPGDVLVSTVRPYLRNVAIVRKETDGNVGSTAFCVLRSNGSVEPEYLFRWTLTKEFFEGLVPMQRGISYPAVRDADVLAQVIPLAPLAEQRRIVAKSKALFEQSRTTRQALDRIPPLVKKFRQSVLATAFCGDLTRGWREEHPDIEPASALLERIRAERRRKREEDLRSKGKDPHKVRCKDRWPVDDSDLPELPKGWVWVKFGSLISFVTSGSRGWAKYYSDTGPMFLRVGNLDHDSISLDLARVVRVEPADGAEIARTKVQPGDILISITADVGMVAVVPEDIGDAYINQHVALARPLPGPSIPYLAYYLASQDGGQEQFAEMQYGMTKIGLNLANVQDVRIPFAPLSEQRQMVAKIDEMFAHAEVIQAAVEAVRRRADRLDQSILARAFRGKLVPQDPNDEPASVLLERICNDQEVPRRFDADV